MMTLKEEFSAEVEAFLEQSGTAATRLGKDALGDPTFVFELRRGRSVSVDIIDRVRAYMRKTEAA